MVIYSGFSNALSETLWTYTFYVIVCNCWWNQAKLFNILAEIKSIMLQVWKLRSRKTLENVLLKISKKFPGKHLYQALFFKKVEYLRPATTVLQKKLWHLRFPVNFAKFLRTPFLTEHLRWLLLTQCSTWCTSTK